jgi:mannose/fructose-specific phosphotransferase system component IIA
MIGILIVSHEPLGTALLNCTRHIYGRLPVQLAALDVIPDEDPAAAVRAAGDLMSRINDGSGVVVLTDVFGATPSRIARGLADPGRERLEQLLASEATPAAKPPERLLPEVLHWLRSRAVGHIDSALLPLVRP